MPRRWGIVGAGAISFSHATALLQSTHADLVGIADIEPAALERAAVRFGVATFATAEELLDNARPDAVTIALPSEGHLLGARVAASRGVHVLCEKPLASTVAECDEMLVACRTAHVRLGAILNNRGYAQARWLRERIRAEAFHPRVFSVTLAMAAPAGVRPPTARALLFGAGIHYVDLLAWWLGPLRSVAAVPAPPGATCAGLRFGDTSDTFRLSAFGPTGRPVRIDIDGDEGHVAFDGATLTEIDAEVGSPPPPAGHVEGMRFGTGHLIVVDEAAAALERGDPFPVAGEEGREAVAMVDRIAAVVSETAPCAALL